LDGFTITQASVADLANVQVDAQNIAITSADIDLNGNAYKANTSGTITFTGPVGLDASAGTVTIQTAGADADDITFSGTTSTIDDSSSNNTLVINTGAEGDVSFGASIGAGTPIGAITMSTVDNVAIAGNAITSAGAITITGDATDAITLTGTSNTTAITSGGADTEDITIAGIVNDASSDTILSLVGGASGDVTLSSAVGGTNALDGFKIQSAQNVSLGAVTVDGAAGTNTIDLGATSAIDGTVTLNGDLSTAGAAGGTHTGALRLNASGTVNLAASVTLNTANAGGDNSGNITLLGGGTLQSSSAWVQGITLDANDGAGGTDGAVDLSAITFSSLDHLEVESASLSLGDTTLGDGANNPGDANTGLKVTASGNITLNGDISTAGDSSDNAGAISLSATSIILNSGGSSDANTVSITTNASGTDAAISLGAVEDGGSDKALTIDSGSANFTTTSTIGNSDTIGALTISAADLILGGAVKVGSNNVSITETDGHGIALGTALSGTAMDITDAELAFIFAQDVTLISAGKFTVNGVTASNTANIAGTTLLDGSGEVEFSSGVSVFTNGLTVQADDLVDIDVAITTTAGNLSIDGDADNATDTNDNVDLGSGVTLTATSGNIQLDATNGSIVLSGSGDTVTLQTSGGVGEISLTDQVTDSNTATDLSL
jgi:hypothetical protein